MKIKNGMSILWSKVIVNSHKKFQRIWTRFTLPTLRIYYLTFCLFFSFIYVVTSFFSFIDQFTSLKCQKLEVKKRYLLIKLWNLCYTNTWRYLLINILFIKESVNRVVQYRVSKFVKLWKVTEMCLFMIFSFSFLLKTDKVSK